MFKKISVLLIVAAVSIAASGCSSVLIPYSSSYSCPESKGDMGNCNSLVKNYRNSFKKVSPGAENSSIENCPESLRGTAFCSASDKIADSGPASKGFVFSSMRQAVLKHMFLSRPVPLRIPSTVKKALIMPYAVGKEFHGFNEVYFVSSPGRWLLGNYLDKSVKMDNQFIIFRH